jgi:hypothetical protein
VDRGGQRAREGEQQGENRSDGSSGGGEELRRRWGEERGGNGEKGAGCRGFNREGNGDATEKSRGGVRVIAEEAVGGRSGGKEIRHGCKRESERMGIGIGIVRGYNQVTEASISDQTLDLFSVCSPCESGLSTVPVNGRGGGRGVNY